MGVNALFSFTVFVIGSILTCILLYRQRKPSTAFLAFFLFTLTATNFLLFLFESHYMLYVPFFLRTGPLLNYLTAPALMFYVVYVFNEERPARWYDSLHLLPALLYLIDYIPLFISSNDYKREIILGMYNNLQVAFKFKEGWLLPDGWHYVARHLVAICYLVYMAYLLVRHERSREVKLVKGNYLVSWLKLVLFFFMVFSVTGLITYFFNYSPYAWIATVWEPMVMVALLGVILFFRPQILYAQFETVVYAKSNQVKTKSPILHDEIISELQARIAKYMESKNFLRKNIKLGEVASDLKVQPYILSAYVNHMYQMRFNDLINWWRIQYVKEGLAKGEWDMLTLEAIAEEAGFSNRTTFLNAFKKFTGMTPTAFLSETPKPAANDPLKLSDNKQKPVS